MTTSKIRIKMGLIEVEYEGSESFLRDELPLMLKSISDLYEVSGKEFHQSKVNGQEVEAPKNSEESLIQGTTGSIAGKLSVKSGTDLILAAAARLTFVLDKERFSRKDILEEMKSASAYYKTSYMSNLTTYLNTLVKEGTFLETSTGIYALSALKVSSLKSRLA